MKILKRPSCRLELDFPTTPNPIMDLCVRQHLRWVCEYIIQHLDEENIRAIVLAGSLALGEGSAQLGINGQKKLLSDMDIYIVANESLWSDIEEKDTHAYIRVKNNELNSALNSARSAELLSPIDTIIVTPKGIRSWWTTPRIVILQLAGTARVLWGDKDFLPDISSFSQEKITDEDILKLINNRIAEQIFYFVNYTNDLDGPECFIYHSAKAIVDAVLAICVAARCYRPKLLSRLSVFEDLCHRSRLGMDMIECARFWTRYKLTPDFTILTDRFNTQVMEAAYLAWEEAANFLLQALSWLARTRLGIVEKEIELLVMFLARHFGLSRSAFTSLRTLVLNPPKLLRHLMHKYKLSRIDLFAQEMRIKNLPVPDLARLKRFSRWGTPCSLTYAVATLLLATKGKTEIEQRRLLAKASDLLPVVEPILHADVAKWWLDLASETAKLWNRLVMDGRR